MKFSFTSLGSASALPTVNRFPSAHVLNVHERIFLIDCGEGCQMQLRRFGFSFLKIREIFISHLHGDHIFGLYGLLSTMSLLGRSADLFIYAPSAFQSILSSFLEHFGNMFKFSIKHIVLKGNGAEVILDARKYEVLSFPLNHRVDCYGFIFREKTPVRNVYKEFVESENLSLTEIASLKNGRDVIRENGEILDHLRLTYQPYAPRSFAYCSDTAPFTQLPQYLHGVNLIYHEATFGNDMEKMARDTMHSTAADAAKCAADSGAERLLIGHFSSRYRDVEVLLNEARAIFPETFVADEGMEFNIQQVKTV
ncbi:ribonuclease Z [Bacteroidota bacterium]